MTQEAANLAPYITVLPLLAATPAARTTIDEFTNSWMNGDRLCTEASVLWRRLMQTLTCDTLRYP
jgi:hypothetical protein